MKTKTTRLCFRIPQTIVLILNMYVLLENCNKITLVLQAALWSNEKSYRRIFFLNPNVFWILISKTCQICTFLMSLQHLFIPQTGLDAKNNFPSPCTIFQTSASVLKPRIQEAYVLNDTDKSMNLFKNVTLTSLTHTPSFWSYLWRL